ncbi:RDD [Candidatus Nanopelagicaceae bacterium]
MYPRVSQGRRLLGITVDWLACYAIALGFFAGSGSFTDRVPSARIPVLLLLFAEYTLFVALGGASFGHRIVGLKVVRFSDGGSPTPTEALIRGALLIPLITAITFDENGRGINERFSNTVLVKTR